LAQRVLPVIFHISSRTFSLPPPWLLHWHCLRLCFQVLTPKTGAYKSVTLNDEHRVKIYGQYAKQCVDMLGNDYHKVFLTLILTQILKEGL
jgi:hypothetical protein